MRGCGHLLYHCLVGLQRELGLEGQGQLIKELCGSLASVSLPLGGGGGGRERGRGCLDVEKQTDGWTDGQAGWMDDRGMHPQTGTQTVGNKRC